MCEENQFLVWDTNTGTRSERQCISEKKWNCLDCGQEMECTGIVDILPALKREAFSSILRKHKEVR